MKVSLIPDIIFCGWLGLKQQLTNPSYFQVKDPLTKDHKSKVQPDEAHPSPGQTCGRQLMKTEYLLN